MKKSKFLEIVRETIKEYVAESHTCTNIFKTSIIDPATDNDMNVEVEYEGSPGCKGSREGGTGLQMEPDEEASLAIIRVTNLATGENINFKELDNNTQEDLTDKCWDNANDEYFKAQEDRYEEQISETLNSKKKKMSCPKCKTEFTQIKKSRKAKNAKGMVNVCKKCKHKWKIKLNENSDDHKYQGGTPLIHNGKTYPRDQYELECDRPKSTAGMRFDIKPVKSGDWKITPFWSWFDETFENNQGMHYRNEHGEGESVRSVDQLISYVYDGMQTGEFLKGDKIYLGGKLFADIPSTGVEPNYSPEFMKQNKTPISEPGHEPEDKVRSDEPEPFGYDKGIDHDELHETVPPGFPSSLSKKLVKQYKGNSKAAYATMWKLHKQHPTKLEEIDKALEAQELEETVPPGFPAKLSKKLLGQHHKSPNKAYKTMWKLHKQHPGKLEEIWAAWDDQEFQNKVPKGFPRPLYNSLKQYYASNPEAAYAAANKLYEKYGESLEEVMQAKFKKVPGSVQKDVHTVKLTHKPSTAEYVIVWNTNGKRDENKCYYTDERQDAVETLKLMQADADKLNAEQVKK